VLLEDKQQRKSDGAKNKSEEKIIRWKKNTITILNANKTWRKTYKDAINYATFD